MAFPQDVTTVSKFGLKIDTTKTDTVRRPGNAIPGSELKALSRSGRIFYFWRLVNKSIKGGFEYLCRIDEARKDKKGIVYVTIKNERVVPEKWPDWLKVNTSDVKVPVDPRVPVDPIKK